MPLLPNPMMLGPFSLSTPALMGLLGGLAAYLLSALSLLPANHAGSRENHIRRGAQDLIISLILGGILGAKLVYHLLDLSGTLANPATLLIFPHGPLVLPAATAGAAAAALVTLWRQPDRLQVLDQSAGPAAAGAALATLGLQTPGAWAFPLLLGVAAVGSFIAARFTVQFVTVPGRHAAQTAVMLACALVLADLGRPDPGLISGITWLQLLAATVGTGAWLWTRKDPEI